jgi:drug/metabolite transporter (DMT)-like permease
MTQRHAEILLLLVSMIAAVGWILSKASMAEFQPYTFMGLRFLLAALALSFFCIDDLRRLSINQILRCLATGSALGCGLLSWSVGLHLSDKVGEGAFIVSLSVVAVPIIGRLFFAEKIAPLLLFSLIPAVSGLYFLSLDNLSGGLGFYFEKSQWLFLLSTVAFGFHLNLSGYFVKNIPPLALSSLQLGMAGTMAAIGAVVLEKDFNIGQVSNTAWYLLLASALFATSFRFAMQTRALQHLKPSHASMIFLAEPLCTALMSIWWLNETMSANQIMGCLLIFSGVCIYRGVPFLKGLLESKSQ